MRLVPLSYFWIWVCDSPHLTRRDFRRRPTATSVSSGRFTVFMFDCDLTRFCLVASPPVRDLLLFAKVLLGAARTLRHDLLLTALSEVTRGSAPAQKRLRRVSHSCGPRPWPRKPTATAGSPCPIASISTAPAIMRRPPDSAAAANGDSIIASGGLQTLWTGRLLSPRLTTPTRDRCQPAFLAA